MISARLKNTAAVVVAVGLLGFVAMMEWPAVQAYALVGASYPGTSVSYRINPNFVDGAAGTEAQQIAALQAGADAWPTQAGINFAFNYAGQTTINTVAFDGTNTVFYSHTDGNGALAVCNYWTSGGQMYQFDIQFFDRDGAFNYIWSHTPSMAQFDIQGVATHEFGHALGLGHSPVAGATMYPSIGPGDTSARTLHSDDIQGAQSIYDLMPPVVTGCTPDHAWIGGGTTVTVTGQHFSSSSLQVRFGGQLATNVQFVAATTITCTVPPGTLMGQVPVQVCCGGQCGSASVFSYDTVRMVNSAPQGGVSLFQFHAPGLGGHAYQAVVSVGTAGIPLSQCLDPADTRIVPIEDDAMLQWQLDRQMNDEPSWFGNFASMLDAAGMADGFFGVPTAPQAAGHTLQFSWVVWDPTSMSYVAHVGNRVSVTITP